MLPENVKCPLCAGPMVSRTSQHGVFWGCRAFPKCRGTRDVMGESRTPRGSDEDWRGGSNSTEEFGLPSERQRARDRRRW